MNQPEFRLDPDEREIWRGDPVIAPVRTPFGGLFILMGLSAFPVIGILLFIMATMVAEGAPAKSLMIIGIVSLVVFIESIVIFSSPWLLKRPLRQLFYRITDKRVLILKRDKKEGCHLLKGIPFSEINRITFKAGKSGHGYVQLKNDPTHLLLRLFILPPTTLYNIENPEHVMQIIQSRRDHVSA